MICEIIYFIDCLLKTNETLDMTPTLSYRYTSFSFMFDFMPRITRFYIENYGHNLSFFTLRLNIYILLSVNSQFFYYFGIRKEGLKNGSAISISATWHLSELSRNIGKKCYRSMSSMISRISRGYPIWIMDDPHDDSRR